MFTRWIALTWLVLAAATSTFAANPFVHQLFTSHMVLQRDASDPIWGWTTPGNTVSVTVFDETGATCQTVAATADSGGRWQAAVGPFGLVTGNAPYSIAVAATGQTTSTFTDVLIGDVFLCSGQSNMDYTVNNMGGTPVYNSTEEVADSANYPMIRQFYVPHTSVRDTQQTLPTANWVVAGAATTGGFTATGYFMAREIYKQQGVPVGILCSAWAGSEIKLWLPPDFVSTFADYTQPIFDRPATDNNISGAYNGMIAPIAPFKFKAVTWYQGEFNYTLPEQYSRLLPALMSSWRSLFAQPNLPFLVVQIPNSTVYSGLREAQMNTVKNDSNSRLVITMETGEQLLHPLDKQDVGLRAAWAAADLVYGKTVVSQGPIFSGASISGNTIRCSFTNAGGGLMVGLKTIQKSGAQTPAQELVGGTLAGFKVAGSNKVFYAATATIDNATNTVVVSSASVPSPLYVRYAWDNPLGANLFNKITDSNGVVVDGISASSFRNDPTCVLTVNGGATSGTYALGSNVAITGSVTGETFDHWSGDTSVLSGTSSPNVMATISQTYTSVFANYRVTGAPTHFAATPGAGQLTLNWDAMNCVHYNVKRSTTPGGTYTTVGSNLTGTTAYVDTGLTQGVSYYYVISAIGPMGEGPNSAEINAQTLPVVENLKAVTGTAQVGLTWTPPVGNITSYTVKRSTVSGGPYVPAASGLSSLNYTDRSVLAGITYYYVVSAFSGGEESLNCPEVSAVPTFLPPPFQDVDIGTVGISGGAYSTASGSYSLVYSGSTIGNSTGADTFNFAYNSTQVSGTFTFTARVASLSNGSSSPEVGIMVRQALAGTGAYVRTYVNSTQTCYQGRSGVTGSPGTSASTSANRWIRITRDSSNNCRGYVSADGSTWTQQGTAVTVSGAVYLGFAATAKNNAVSNSSTFDNVSLSPSWTLEVPGAPNGLNAAHVTGDSTALLTWSAAPGALAYNVKQSTTRGGGYTPVASGINAVSFTATGLSAGTTMYYVVSATGSMGEGANSVETVVDMEAPVINPISDMVAVATGATGAVVNFSPVANDDVDGSVQTTSAPASGTLFPIGTTPVTVRATDAAGNAASRAFTVTVNLQSPSNLVAMLLSDTQVRLDWINNAPGASVYTVQRSLHGANTWVTLTSSLNPGSNFYVDQALNAATQYDYRIQCAGSGGVSDYVSVSATTPAEIGDGIPGWWRYQYFGNGVAVTTASASDADPDGDGADNLREYLAGTDPTNAQSLLKATRVERVSNDIVIHFTTVLGKTYRLEKTSDLGAAASWTPVRDNIAGTGGIVTGTDAGGASQPRQFYRAVVK